MIKEDYTEIAKQLSCPTGELGKTVGDQMFLSNRNMIFKTIDRLDVKDGANILEFGFGGGKHIYYLLSKGKNINYTGIEISPLMVEVSLEENKSFLSSNLISFLHKESTDELSFEGANFDHCLAVNTVYFWSDPAKQLQEIHRVLKVGGVLALSFIREDFIITQPFVKEEYFYYHKTDRLIRLMKNIGFSEIEQWQYVEKTLNKVGESVVRPFIVLRGIK